MYKASILRPIALILAVVPSLLLLWFFYKRDYFPEPKKVFWVTFALGILIIIPALVIGFPIRMYISTSIYPYDTFLYCFILAFGIAGFLEEMLKFCVLRFYSYRNKAFDEPMDGIVYGVAASLGFATLFRNY